MNSQKQCMSPKEEAQNSAQRKEDYTAARTNALTEDKDSENKQRDSLL